jgi:formamidopyrimidine-DNA glycosylase
MPELPDVTLYLEALQSRVLGQRLERCLIVSPFLLRTAQPSIEIAQGRQVVGLRRVGKRIAIGLEGDFWLLLHLMLAGRLHWFDRGSPLSKRPVLARFEFTNGTLTLTESGTKRRASLHFIHGEHGMAEEDPGGIEVLQMSLEQFAAQLQGENHTLKRALTDPHLFSGIGNAYSDEILHAAKLSPVAMSRSLDYDETVRLYGALQGQLRLWIDRLRTQAGAKFPEGVTAFRDGMAVHGRFGKACPVCGTAVQRIRYAHNETNYCPRCQTGGRLLADRALSRLLKKDWPRTIDAYEKQRGV